jgi:phosphatidylinositol-3-phosphatase
MENHNWTGGKKGSNIKGNANAPYINNTLLAMASHAEQYFNPPGIHPSLPNYLWLEAGTNFGILDDNPPRKDSQPKPNHLVTYLNNAGISWKAYQEDISGTACPLTDSGEYAVRHDPFVYFDDVTNNQDLNSAYCIAHVRPYSELANDLTNNTVVPYNFIPPNVCDDMHDRCKPQRNSIKQGDTWLANNVPAILNSAAYQNGGALLITWDEDLNRGSNCGHCSLAKKMNSRLLLGQAAEATQWILLRRAPRSSLADAAELRLEHPSRQSTNIGNKFRL